MWQPQVIHFQVYSFLKMSSGKREWKILKWLTRVDSDSHATVHPHKVMDTLTSHPFFEEGEIILVQKLSGEKREWRPETTRKWRKLKRRGGRENVFSLFVESRTCGIGRDWWDMRGAALESTARGLRCLLFLSPSLLCLLPRVFSSYRRVYKLFLLISSLWEPDRKSVV